MEGRCYEILQKKGQISKVEGFNKTSTAYMKVVSKFPDCPAVKHATDWLSQQTFGHEIGIEDPNLIETDSVPNQETENLNTETVEYGDANEVNDPNY